VAFNDHAPGTGTHANATRYHAYANGYPSSGQLRNIVTGTNLNARVAITRSGTEVAGLIAAVPYPGTPLHAVFNGFADFAGTPQPNIEIRASYGEWVTYTFTSLAPAKRYRFHGSAIRAGGDYTNRWALCEIVGALAHTSAHSSNVLTAAQVPGSLTAAQAALQTGVNHTATTGDYVCWDNIQPAANGSFAVISRQYTGAVPGGSSAGPRAYALTGIRLEEISGEEEVPVAVLSQPQDQIVYEGRAVSFSADASGNPIFYQWFKNGQPIAGATNRVFSIPSATIDDEASYSFVVSNALNSATSSNAWLAVVIPQIIEWGRNDYGQVDVPYFLSNVVMMAAGSWHGLALQGDGRVIGWGRNDYGQLNIPPDVTNSAVIAAGYFFSMAIMPNGTVRCWGDNSWGASSPPANLSNVVMVAPGYDHALALKADGTVVAWGRNSDGQASVPAGLSNVVKIFAGGYGSFALRANGTVAAWGLNTYGQLNVPPALTNIVALAPANWHTLALTSDGGVWAWGNNTYGQCNVPAGLSNVVAIAVGGGFNGSHSLALKDDGTVVAWGYNSSGQGTVPAGLPKGAQIAGGEYYSMVMNSTDETVSRPVLLPAPFVVGVLNRPFHHRLVVRNGPVTFSVSGLPPGMALDTTTGLLGGMPSSVGTFSVLLSVTNSFGGDERWMTVIIQSNSLPPVVVDPLAFPLTANQRGTVTCLENSTVSYDAYLPPGYATNGAPLPILYTLNPDGGGMVGAFQAVCSSLNIIAVGITGSRNGASWDTILREFYAVSRDVRQRVLSDPTAELVGGFSGGGECSYVFSRFRAQHVAGVFAMAAWLGRTSGYYSTDRVQTNLLVARSTGTSDAGANYYLEPDSNYLASCGAVIRDWSFAGGHSVPPDSVKVACLSWLLSQRIPAAPEDRSNALAEASDWRSRVAGGQRESVLRECIEALMTQPRTWRSLQAQLVLDDLIIAYDSFRPLAVQNLAAGDFASDLFYYAARGAANVSDWPRYYSCLKALTGISGTLGDRAGDIRDLLLQHGYPAPVLHCTALPGPTALQIWILKDSPGLDYALKARSDLAASTWGDVLVAPLETSTEWSAEVDLPPGTTNGFYRLWMTPAPATNSPPLPL